MIDVIIPLGNGSHYDDIELLFCLRSIEQHVNNVGTIFIIGQCPEWLQNVIHIPFSDSTEPRQKEHNIVSKIIAACDDDRVSDNFLFFNDDHFILQDVDGETFPLHYKGTLQESMRKATPGNAYRVSVDNTLRLLTHLHKTLWNYDTHCPIVYNKAMFKEAMSKCNWSRPYGYVIKSMYANYHGLKGTYYMDCKIRDAQEVDSIIGCIANRLYFTVDDAAFNYNMRTVLLNKFPNKSKYETNTQDYFDIVR